MTSSTLDAPFRSQLGGQVRVLMADGQPRPISEVRRGDRVYGTERGATRRYLGAVVTAQDHVSVPGYRIELADGTTLLAGPDQALLSYRGWKRTTGSQHGARRRAHLTERAVLLGTGRFADGPSGGRAYRRGYLCGLIRGDGHVGSYHCRTRSGRRWIKHGFRLALADAEPLDRATEYLADEGVEVTRFLFQRGTPTRKPSHAIGNQTREGVDRVRGLMDWCVSPDVEWRLGFLAGIFDAEGSCGRHGVLRICNTEASIINHTLASLGHLGFDVAVEKTVDRSELTYLRIRGGICERLRFFHLTDPCIARKRSLEGRRVRSDADLRVRSIEPLGSLMDAYELVTSSGDLIAEGLVASAGLTA